MHVGKKKYMQYYCYYYYGEEEEGGHIIRPLTFSSTDIGLQYRTGIFPRQGQGPYAVTYHTGTVLEYSSAFARSPKSIKYFIISAR